MRVRLPKVLMAMLVIGIPAASGISQVIAPERAVTGESWLNHLQRPFNESSMGKTGDLGPAAPMPGEEKAQWSPSLSPRISTGKVALKGSDLYRFNCRGCHGDTGLGAPPEIRSLINPVRATSATLVMERMKNSGMEISRADAAHLAAQAKDSLLLRLQKGGEAMPPFDRLQPKEERLLISYLNELAGVSGETAAQDRVSVSSVRVGELIVKSTCHVCHDAAGANPGPQQMLEGAIPPLSTLTSRTNEAEFIRKVTHGSPVLMGDPPIPQRGRMPVFFYLSEDEAADVYLYLMLYPPRQAVGQETVATRQDQGRGAVVAATTTTNNSPRPPSSPAADATSFVLISLLAGFVSALLFGGLAITISELKRLSIRSEIRELSEDAAVPAMQA